MFYKFTTSKEYPKDQWESIWEIEHRLAALFLADYEILKPQSKEELEAYLHERAHEFIGPVVESSQRAERLKLFDQFLDEQSDAIFAYLSSVDTVEPDVIVVANLDLCIAESDDFRRYLREQGKAAEAEFDELYG